MRYIDQRTELDFRHALRCVEYRLPNREGLKPEGMRLALGLRYGLIGAAAVRHLLHCGAHDVENLVGRAIYVWPELVSEHARNDALHRMGLPPEPESADEIGAWARQALGLVIPAPTAIRPLTVALSVAADDFLSDHRQEIVKGWNVLLKGRGERLFRETADVSVRYASSFFDRRKCGLAEVPEIALLGE